MKIREVREPSGDSASALRLLRRERRQIPDSSIFSAVCALMDQIGHAIVLTSPAGRLLFVNGRARALAERPESLLQIHRQQLTIDGQPAQARIDQHGTSKRAHYFAFLRTNRDRTKQYREYRVLVTRLGLRRATDPVAIRIYEPHGDHKISPDVLRELYRLTHAETHLTTRLFAGLTLGAIAQERGLSIHTVRSQVKRVFQKCQVKSQVELARFLACGPGVT